MKHSSAPEASAFSRTPSSSSPWPMSAATQPTRAPGYCSLSQGTMIEVSSPPE